MQEMKIQRNARVMASDGEVGRVKQVVVDRETREVTELVVEHDGQERLIPASAVVSADATSVTVNGKRAQYRSASGYNRDEFRAVDDKRADAENQGRATQGGKPLRDAQDDAVVIGGAATPARPAPPATPAPGREQRPVRPTERADEGRIQLREEELRARKQMVQTGEVEIRTEVVEEQKTIDVPVIHEEVIVERRPTDRRPASGPITESDEVIEVPIHEEQVSVEKRAVVYEEVEIGKRAVQETETVSDTVRREVAEITTEGDVDVGDRPAGTPPPKDTRRQTKGR